MINAYRVNHAVSILLSGKDFSAFREIYTSCGFSSKSTFYAAFTKVMGMAPLQFMHKVRKKGGTAEDYCPVKTKKAILSSLSSSFLREEPV